MIGNLRKITIVDEAYFSVIAPGRSQKGTLQVFRIDDNGERNKLDINNLNEIQKDDEVISWGGGITNFIKTSPVKNIVEIEDNYIKFETWTSLYEIKVENETENQEN
tara:strand:+ start:1834 stop:2154 length:321 start_codon:yes stop_codon:yes gene_type:complete